MHTTQSTHRRSWWPLAIMGYVLVAYPMVATVRLATKSMDTTVSQGQTLNYRLYEETRVVRLVLEKASDIERKARLFVLLSDPALRQPYERDSYENVRTTFQQALGTLRALSPDREILLLANELTEKEGLIYQQLTAWDPKRQAAPAIDQAFLGLREAATALSRKFESHVDQEFTQLRAQTEAIKQQLVVRSGMLLALSLGLLVGLLTWLKRPLTQRFRDSEDDVHKAVTASEPPASQIEGEAS
jgi:two-component system, NtrC family, sensor histidine kinase GlrK